MTWKPGVVLYHGPSCLDGFGSAFAAWLKWGDAVAYIPCSYGEPAPIDRCAGKNVLIVDFSFKRDVMAEFGRSVKSCVVLDHHKSVLTELEEWVSLTLTPAHLGNLVNLDGWHDCAKPDRLPIVALFDMEKSGARLAWEFCHPDKAVPSWVEFIEDRDLWRFKFGETTHEFIAGLNSHPRNFTTWSALFQHASLLVSQGRDILRAHRRLVDEFCNNAYVDEIGGFTVPVLNVNYPYVSDCGRLLLKLYPNAPFAACWSRSGDKIGWSLRSEDSREDVSVIAAKFGGGGHRNAAGFERKRGVLESGPDNLRCGLL